MGSSQWGKTTIACGLIAFHVQHDPCSIMLVSPTEEMARDFSRTRMDPMIRNTSMLAEAMDQRRNPSGSNTTLFKTFVGGILALPGANSPSSLAARAIRLLILDEVDRYPQELAKEGSTISIAERRQQTYGRRRRLLKISSPTTDTGQIAVAHARGDQRKFWIPCPVCEFWHDLRWEDVHWPDADPDRAHFACPACAHPLTTAERNASVDRGRWVATAVPLDRTIRSYHMWSGYSPLAQLSDLVRDFIKAVHALESGDNTLWRTFRQTVLGEPVSEDDASQSPITDRLRADLLASRGVGWEVPSDVRVVASADVHKDRIEVLVTAWSKDEECWVLDHQVLVGQPEEEDVWDALDDLRRQQYAGHEIERLHIDSGYLPATVYQFVLTRQRQVFAIKGYHDRPMLTAPRKPEPGPKGRKCLLLIIGTDEAKSIATARLAKRQGPGAIHLPMAPWCDREFIAQLTSEELQTAMVGGHKVTRWVQIRDRNEALDLICYATHAMRWLMVRRS